jgi:hypothetical protein
MPENDRKLIARVAAHASWAATSDRSARTAPARQANRDRWLNIVDPDGIMPTGEREKRAESARKAHYARMALKSAQVRRERKAAGGSK